MNSALPPEADKPRIVIDYGGMQVLDCREHVRVRLVGDPPPGLRWRLGYDGFKPMPGDRVTFYRTANPQTFFDAQAIGREFFPAVKP